MNYDHAKGNAVPSEPELKVVSVSIGSRSGSPFFFLCKARWEKQPVLQEKLQNFNEEVLNMHFGGGHGLDSVICRKTECEQVVERHLRLPHGKLSGWLRRNCIGQV